MSFNVAVKTFAIASGSVVFNLTDPDGEKLMLDNSRTFINVVSLDDVDGNPVQPGDGEYFIGIELVPEGGFQRVPDNGTLDATKTGGTATTDRTVLSASVNAPSNRIQVVAVGVTVATHARVTITQNLT